MASQQLGDHRGAQVAEGPGQGGAGELQQVWAWGPGSLRVPLANITVCD